MARSKTRLLASLAGSLFVAVVLAVVAVVVAGVLVRPATESGPPAEPVEVAPPPGVELPRLGAPAPVADEAGPQPLRPAAVRAALAPELSAPSLGRHVLATVAPLAGPGTALSSGPADDVATPASTTKLFTSAAALLSIGPEVRFATRVVATGRNQLVLVGGGDPFLASQPPEDPTTYPPRADVDTLARGTARALRRNGSKRPSVRLGFDDSLFSGPAVSPRWPASYIPDGVVSPVHALWVDEGRDPVGYGRVADPAASAALVFADRLRAAGVRVVGVPTRTTAPGSAREVASVESATVAQIVERVLEVSDNEAAEVLLRQVGLATGGGGSFVGGQRGVRRTLADAGLALRGPEVLWDGSGLSRDNRLAPATLVDVLRLSSSEQQPDLRPVVTGLSVAGYLGSLSDRLDTGDPRAPGRVRAKTGTLTGVFALAGIAVDRTGAPVVFALMADRIKPPRTLEAQQAMDEAAAALAGCACTRSRSR